MKDKTVLKWKERKKKWLVQWHTDFHVHLVQWQANFQYNLLIFFNILDILFKYSLNSWFSL